MYNYGRLTTAVIRIFSFSSMFVITFGFYMVISDISSCFFDRCFLHQSAPTEAWRITLSNPTRTWSLGSNQVPLYLHKLLLGLGFFGGGGVHCLQGIVINSAKNQWYVYILKSLWGVGWGGVYIVYRILYSIQPKTSSNLWYIYQFINFFEGWAGMCLFSGSADFFICHLHSWVWEWWYIVYIWIMYLVLVSEKWGNGHFSESSINLNLIWTYLIAFGIGHML